VPDLKLRWDNTLKYSAAWRTQGPGGTLTRDANLDDGDRNFKRGLVSNRLDLFSELDLSYRDFGFRASGAAWYDAVYNRTNSNDSPFTANASSVPSNEFPHATRDLMGRKAELLDAFAFGSGSLGGMPASFRLGRHSVLYGESLFFGANGIAGGQSPVDYIKLIGVPSSQFKEVIRPEPQLSAQLQVKPWLTIGGYYQFAWDPDRIPPVGSYLSNNDILDAGGERILAGPNAIIPGGAPFAFYRGHDLFPRNSGQYGLQIRLRPAGQETEYGIYAIRFHAKDPVVYVYPNVGFNPGTGQIGEYGLAYAQDISAVGASFNTNLGDFNFGGEASLRYNAPLTAHGGSVVVAPGVAADNDSNPLYPVGKTAHAQLSSTYILPRTPLFDSGLLLVEVAWNRALSVNKNASAVDPNSSRDASAVRAVIEPTWYAVAPGLDVSVPLGVGYGISGKSRALGPNFAVPGGGDLSIGVKGLYEQAWHVALNYVHFYGPTDGVLTPPNQPVQFYSYGQALHDRDFISFTVSRTF